MDVTPVADRAGDVPGDTGLESRSARQVSGLDRDHLDLLDLGAGAALAGKLETAPGLEIGLGQEITGDAAVEDIVDRALLTEIEGAIDVVE